MAPSLVTRRFTSDEYHQMIAVGILPEEDQVELIEGEIIEMAPIGSRHAACVDRLSHVFHQRVGNQVIIRTQNPIRLNQHSELQPDVCLLKTNPTFYAEEHPGPDDVLLIVEVADTSLETDINTKIPLYAQAGIPEAWVVDLLHNHVEVYRQPTPQGYRLTHRYHSGDTISSDIKANVQIPICDILP